MSQANKIYDLLKDGRPHRTDEIMAVCYGGSHLGLARIGARIWDLKKQGHDFNGWKDKNNPALYWYQLKEKTSEYEEIRQNAMAAFERNEQGRLV